MSSTSSAASYPAWQWQNPGSAQRSSPGHQGLTFHREALKRTLLASKSIALSAAGPSGVYLSGLFQKWGIADELKPKIKQSPGQIGDVLARGGAEIGFQQVSELIAAKGITYLGPLPDDIQLITVFSGGVHSQAKNPAGAAALLKFLTSPDAVRAIRKAGMEPG